MNPTQSILWDNILQFDLDHPVSEYGFSVRLAYENGWSLSFTQRAILEYKRFMFLAAVSREMVSPSHIVDMVWHQHLIFTVSYNNFCGMLGKQVAHIPSTHNYEERDKFEQAMNHTAAIYRQYWGEPPADIWRGKDPLDAISALPAGQTTYQRQTIMGFALCLVMLIPFYFFTQSTIAQIDNPYFLTGYGMAFLAFLGALVGYRTWQMRQIAISLFVQGHLKHLAPFELVYAKRGKTADIIHGVMNRLYQKKKIAIGDNKITLLAHTNEASDAYEMAVLQSLKESGDTYYPALLGVLLKKEVFMQTANFMDKLRKHISANRDMMVLHVYSVVFSALFLAVGATRLLLGIQHEKAVSFLSVFLVIIIAVLVALFFGTGKHFMSWVLPSLYQYRLEKDTSYQTGAEAWQWQYFLVGAALLESAFTPLVTHVEKHNETDGGGSSSCGSSGGSCGGGGGCGGGCGGCGS